MQLQGDTLSGAWPPSFSTVHCSRKRSAARHRHVPRGERRASFECEIRRNGEYGKYGDRRDIPQLLLFRTTVRNESTHCHSQPVHTSQTNDCFPKKLNSAKRVSTAPQAGAVRFLGAPLGRGSRSFPTCAEPTAPRGLHSLIVPYPFRVLCRWGRRYPPYPPRFFFARG